jgi:hypothetical protein
MTRTQDLVVVTFKKDLESFKLLVRSADLFVEDGVFSNYWVITNDEDLNLSFLTEAKHKWNVVDVKDLMGFFHKDGYTTQQILKCQIAKLIDSNWYWILDSKNFFIKKITEDHLFDISGKVRISNVFDIRNPWVKSWDLTASVFEILPQQKLFIENVTPYAIKTELMRSMIDYLVCKHKQEFPTWFYRSYHSLFPLSFNEFYLYNHWLIRENNILDLYILDPNPLHRCIPIRWYDHESRLCFHIPYGRRVMGIHRNAFEHLNQDHRILLARFLCNIKLFNNEEDVFTWINAAIELQKS